MKARSFAILVLVVGLALVLTRGGAAQELDASAGPVAADTETRFTRHGEVIRETIVVPFEYGIVGVTTSRPYTGTVGVSVSGVGQASGTHWSDAFYIYTDLWGQPVTPWHPTEFYNWTLWVNGGPSDDFVQPIPAYNAAHEYSFRMNAPGGPLTFAVGDAGTADNTGAYTVTITDYASLPYAAYLPFLARNRLESVRVPVLRLAYYPPDPVSPD